MTENNLSLFIMTDITIFCFRYSLLEGQLPILLLSCF